MDTRGNKGWSTRYIHTKRKLPKHVQYFDVPNSKNKYRVCRKIDGEVVTFGYFRRVKDAAPLAELVDVALSA